MDASIEVSFVVPAHNEERYLARTLQAILDEIAASGITAEVIVVDNASNDGTAAVAASFPGVIVVHEAEKGLVQARRAGFVRSRGTLVANVDADTMVTKGWLARVASEFRRHPGLVGLSGPYIYYDLSRGSRALVRAFYCMGYLAYMLNRFVLRTGSMLQGGNFVVRREALVRIGGFNPQFSFYGEDTDLACRLNAVGAVKFTFRLPALSSGRRLAEEGLFRIGLRYAMNFVWATFLHKPFTGEWIDVRR
jgi:glycosyltransferase involved in cell wall biosynthesis